LSKIKTSIKSTGGWCHKPWGSEGLDSKCFSRCMSTRCQITRTRHL